MSEHDRERSNNGRVVRDWPAGDPRGPLCYVPDGYQLAIDNALHDWEIACAHADAWYIRASRLRDAARGWTRHDYDHYPSSPMMIKHGITEAGGD